MKPVMQTIMMPPLGNCFSACVASILELDIEEVPSFCQHPLWQDKANEWFAERGLWFLDLDWVDGSEVGFSTGVMQNAVCILSGPSPRGAFHHSVVGRMECGEGEIRVLFEHDPYPGGGWLAECKHVGFIIPKEPR